MSEIIIALDFSDKTKLFSFLDQFKEPVFVKVGMELTYAFNLAIIEELKARQHRIFLDLKLHDIPTTIQNAMQNLARLNIDMVNIHVAGGQKMMEAAIQGIKLGAPNKPPLCIGVTQLTSTSQQMLQEELLINAEMNDVVLRYAALANKSGLNGVVCSVHEVQKIHDVCGKDFICVTPGIRLENDDMNDQKRVATPEYAHKQGADYIVVGRSITTSKHPKQTYDKIKKSMEVANEHKTADC